jgi:chromosome segregation ATPase
MSERELLTSKEVDDLFYDMGQAKLWAETMSHRVGAVQEKLREWSEKARRCPSDLIVIHDQRRKIEGLTTANNNLRAKLTESKKTAMANWDKMMTAQKNMDFFKAQLDEERSKHDSTRRVGYAYQQACESNKREIEKLKAELEQVNGYNDAKRETIERQAEKIKQLEADMADLNGETQRGRADRAEQQLKTIVNSLQKLSTLLDGVGIEVLAEAQHAIWASWMKWMFEAGGETWHLGRHDGEDHWVMSNDKYERWHRQMNTPYADLPEDEKESDRMVVREHLGFLVPWGTASNG